MSNEKQESLADIVAEMRQGMNPNGTAECQYLESDICTLADRIEAAWKREKAAIEADALSVGGFVEAARATTESSSVVGNAAKLREALEDSNELLEELARLGEWWYAAKDQIKANNAALAAPARNCDMYGGDYKMLHTAWFDWTGSPSGQNADGIVKLTFGKWLLAPAIKKGGAK